MVQKSKSKFKVNAISWDNLTFCFYLRHENASSEVWLSHYWSVGANLSSGFFESWIVFALKSFHGKYWTGIIYARKFLEYSQQFFSLFILGSLFLYLSWGKFRKLESFYHQFYFSNMNLLQLTLFCLEHSWAGWLRQDQNSGNRQLWTSDAGPTQS